MKNVKEKTLKKIMEDENFLRGLSIKDTLRFMDKLTLCTKQTEVDSLVKTYHKKATEFQLLTDSYN